MAYYVFIGSVGTAQMVTDDKTGSKLPKPHMGRWIFSKSIELNSGEKRVGAPSEDVIEAVRNHGYYLWL